MTKERSAYYTNKIVNSSMTGIICVMYEMFFEYANEGKEDAVANIDSIRRASRVLSHLRSALDFKYEISKNLFSIYDFCERQLSKAMYTGDASHIDTAIKLMKELNEAFIEVEKQDNSGAAMQNSQHVTAGMTYGRSDLTEMLDNDGNRGFLV